MPNLRGANPVGRGEGSVVSAWRERSAETSRVKPRSVGEGDEFRRESELAGEQQPTAIGCNLRKGGIVATYGGAGRDEVQVNSERQPDVASADVTSGDVDRPLREAHPK